MRRQHMLGLLRLVQVAASTSSALGPTEIDLDATLWEFGTDPSNVGVAEQWYSVASKPALRGTIRTPGAWQAREDPHAHSHTASSRPCPTHDGAVYPAHPLFYTHTHHSTRIPPLADVGARRWRGAGPG